VTEHAFRSIGRHENEIVAQFSSGANQSIDEDDVSVDLKGKYKLAIQHNVIQLMMNGDDIEVAWHSDQKMVKKNNKHYCIDQELVKVMLKKMRKKNITEWGETDTSRQGDSSQFFTVT
jgi:hypothetical protein